VICCDSCPFSPTCEEKDDFLASIGQGEEWGEEYPDDFPYAVRHSIIIRDAKSRDWYPDLDRLPIFDRYRLASVTAELSRARPVAYR
jgi:hypothetical protein